MRQVRSEVLFKMSFTYEIFIREVFTNKGRQSSKSWPNNLKTNMRGKHQNVSLAKSQPHGIMEI